MTRAVHASHLTLVRGSAPALAGRLPLRRGSPLRIQLCPNLGVASVDVRAKLQSAVAILERGLVDDEDRHRLRQADFGSVARCDRLIDGLDRLLHQQSGQLPWLLDPDASMTDAAVVAAEQIS